MEIKNIKFRAKRLDGEGWVKGDLLHSYENGVIIVPIEGGGAFSVDPATVSQFTGLKDDNNGEEVWEHDILASPFLKGEVVFFNGCFRVKKDDGSSLSFPTLSIINGKLRYFSVVGNKFDRKVRNEE